MLPKIIEKKLLIENVEKKDWRVIEKGVTTQVELKLLPKSPSTFEGKKKAWLDRTGWVNPYHATEQNFSSGRSWERSVELKLSRPFIQYVLNAIETHVDYGSAWADATMESEGGRGRLGQNEKGICKW